MSRYPGAAYRKGATRPQTRPGIQRPLPKLPRFPGNDVRGPGKWPTIGRHIARKFLPKLIPGVGAVVTIWELYELYQWYYSPYVNPGTYTLFKTCGGVPVGPQRWDSGGISPCGPRSAGSALPLPVNPLHTGSYVRIGNVPGYMYTQWEYVKTPTLPRVVPYRVPVRYAVPQAFTFPPGDPMADPINKPAPSPAHRPWPEALPWPGEQPSSPRTPPPGGPQKPRPKRTPLPIRFPWPDYGEPEREPGPINYPVEFPDWYEDDRWPIERPDDLPGTRPAPRPLNPTRPSPRPRPGTRPGTKPVTRPGDPVTNPSPVPNPVTRPRPTVPAPVMPPIIITDPYIPNPLGPDLPPVQVQPDTVVITSPKPGSSGTITTIPGNAPNVRPNPNTRQNKNNVRAVAGGAWAVINFVTEGNDFVNVLWEALPEKCKTPKPDPSKSLGVGLHEKMEDLWKCWEHADFSAAIANYANNQFEDYIYGKLGKAGAVATRNLNVTTGLSGAIRRAGNVTQTKKQAARKGSDFVTDTTNPLPVLKYDPVSGDFSLEWSLVGYDQHLGKQQSVTAAGTKRYLDSLD